MAELIPDVIARTDFVEAMKPLMDLLNLTSMQVYSSPMVVADDKIYLNVVAVETVEDWDGGRPKPTYPAVNPSVNEYTELAVPVVVQIEDLA